MRIPSRTSVIAIVASLGCTPTVPAPVTTLVPPPPGVSVAPELAPPSYDCATPKPEGPELRFGDRTMVRVCDGVYVDPATPPDGLELMKTSPQRAAARDVAWYGPLQAPSPLIVFCHTDPCRVFFAGPAKRGWTVRPGRSAPGAEYVSRDRTTLVIVRADARAENMLAHELSHIELAFRARAAGVPAWFDEGLATYVSGEPDCAKPEPPVVPNLRTLDSGDAWRAQTAVAEVRHATYCQACREVAAWMTDDGHERFMALLAAMKAGTRFDRAYGFSSRDVGR